MRHPVLGDRVGDVASSHLGSRLSGGDSVRTCGVVGLAQVREAGLRDDERAAHVDVLHQVVSASLGSVGDRREVDRARVVDADVDAAEALDGLGDGRGRPAPRRGCRRRSAAPRRRRASISSAAVWIVPSSFGCGLSVLAISATLAPSRAARSAIARPMPRLPPLMNAVRPDSGSGELIPRAGGRTSPRRRAAARPAASPSRSPASARPPRRQLVASSARHRRASPSITAVAA